MKKFTKILLLFAAAAILLSLPVLSDEENIPSMFAGDEAWYKDSVYPLVVRDGINYVPAELFSMIDGINVSVPKDDNLLIHNTSNGKYISVLFLYRSAAVNGEIVKDVSVFRSGDVFYLDASLASGALGLILEKLVLENGAPVLRISDEDSVFSLNELIGMYMPKTETSADDDEIPTLPDEDKDFSYDGKLKRIYVLVKSPKFGEETEFPALENCRLHGIGFTHFLSDSDSISELLTSSSMGLYGLAPAGENPADELDTLNSSFFPYTRRISLFTLSTGNDETDAELKKRGYIPIKPDFTVNGTSNPDVLLPTIIQYIGLSGSCTLLLEDCWNSERMAILLSEIESSLYCTSNLADHSFRSTAD